MSAQVLDSCISEALRLRAAPMITREVLEDAFTFRMPSGEDLRFRKGDRLLILPTFLHMDPEIFPDPTQFKYDRFIDPPTSYRKNGADIPFNMALMPFGGGSSYCPGRKFARNEMKTIAVYLLHNFNMTFADPSTAAEYSADCDYSRTGAGTLPPKKGVPVRISPKY